MVTLLCYLRNACVPVPSVTDSTGSCDENININMSLIHVPVVMTSTVFYPLSAAVIASALFFLVVKLALAPDHVL